MCVPETSVLGGGSSRDDLGDEDGRVVSDVRIISSSCDTEAQSRVTLNTHTHTHSHIPTSGSVVSSENSHNALGSDRPPPNPLHLSLHFSTSHWFIVIRCVVQGP